MVIIKDENGNNGEYWYTVSELAKMLNLKDSKGLLLGRNKMFIFLRNNEILMDNNYPYQYYLNLGLVQMYKVVKGNYTTFTPVFSQRGINYLTKRFKNE